MESAYKMEAECIKYNEREKKGERESRKKWGAILMRCRNAENLGDMVEIEREVRKFIGSRKRREKE